MTPTPSAVQRKPGRTRRPGIHVELRLVLSPRDMLAVLGISIGVFLFAGVLLHQAPPTDGAFVLTDPPPRPDIEILLPTDPTGLTDLPIDRGDQPAQSTLQRAVYSRHQWVDVEERSEYLDVDDLID